MEASIRAIHIATVIRLINEQRPLNPTTAPPGLKAAIKEAATVHNTESRRVHRNFVWALDYRGRGAQDRAAMDLIDPTTPEFRLKVQRCLSTSDAAFVVAALDEIGTSPKPTPKPTIITATPTAETAPTPTAVWLNEQIAKGLIDRLTHTVRNRYPIEDIEDVRSEVHLRIAHWCANGSFDEHLGMGKPPTISRMAGWVGNRIKSALGRRGQDALWREMRGSRTEVEYRNEGVHPESVLPYETFQVGFEGGDEGDPKSVQRVIIDPQSLEDAYADEVPSELSIHEAFKLVIRSSRPNASQRYIRILEGMVAEASRGEIATKDGCSPSRAGKLTARVREDLRNALLYTVSDARKVLRYVVEEPCITYMEIIEDLRMDGDDVDRALRFLTDPVMAYLEESTGRSYKATDRGLDAATAPPVGGAVGRLMI